VTHFEDENNFYLSVVEANLGNDVVATILKHASIVLSDEATYDANWIRLDCTLHQLRDMGLNFDLGASNPAQESGVAPDSHDLARALTASPSPIVLMTGPRHVCTFINPAYVKIIGRKSAASVLGLSVREALPELEGQPFFALLDRVYRTGEPYVGREVPCRLLNEMTGEIGEFFFDFVYHPVRDHSGEVTAILCQSNDVTDRVIARQVSEARENRLYEQWAELEAIYKNSPFGMALIDLEDYRIVRLNKADETLLGRQAEEVLGRRIFDLFPDLYPLKAIYERVKAGEEVRNVRLQMFSQDGSGVVRQLLASYSPVFNVRGNIVAVASTCIDLVAATTATEHININFQSLAALSKQSG
jgi:PAS domain S-box-containing protein